MNSRANECFSPMGSSILEPHLFYAQLMLKLAIMFASLIVHAQILLSAAVVQSRNHLGPPIYALTRCPLSSHRKSFIGMSILLPELLSFTKLEIWNWWHILLWYESYHNNL